jgi:hypothetical protein
MVNQKLSLVRDRKDELLNLLLDRVINQQTYEEKNARLNVEIEVVQGELRTAEFKCLDLEGVLAFAEKVISRPARLWMESSLDWRQQLQKTFFPGGIAFNGVEF